MIMNRHYTFQFLVIAYLSISCLSLNGQRVQYFFPEQLQLSEDGITNAFETQDGLAFIMGGGPAWIGTLKEEKEFDIQYSDITNWSVFFEGYETDSSYVVAGSWNKSDLLNDHQIKWGEMDKSGNFLRTRSMFSYDNIVSSGLIRRDGEPDWIVTNSKIVEVGDTNLITIYEHKGDNLTSSSLIDGELFVCSSDSLFIFENGMLRGLEAYSKIEHLFCGASGDAYMITRNQILYNENINNDPHFIPIFTFQARIGRTGFTNIKLSELSDTVWVSYNSKNTRDEITANMISLSGGVVTDTISTSSETYQLNDVTLLQGRPIGIGKQQCCGDFITEGFLFPLPADTPSTTTHDVAIGLSIDSSYWIYDTMPGGGLIFKTHKWDYSVQIENKGLDTVRTYLLFEPIGISVFFFNFRKKYKPSVMIAPGEVKTTSSSATYYTIDGIQKEFCLSVDLPNDQLDGDYSDNSSCVDVPAPRPSSVSDLSSQIELHPNPTSNVLHIDSPYDQWTVHVYDYNGRLVLQKEVNNRLNFSGLASGVYHVRLENAFGVYDQKVVVR